MTANTTANTSASANASANASASASASAMNESTDFLSSPSYRYKHSNSSRSGVSEGNDESGDSGDSRENGDNGEIGGRGGREGRVGGRERGVREDGNDPENDPDSSQNQRYDELAGKLDFLDGELRRRVGELIEAGQRIAGMEKAEGELRTALKVRYMLFSFSSRTLH